MTNRNHRVFRRISPKTFALIAVGLTVLLCIYYSSLTSNDERSNPQDASSVPENARLHREPQDTPKKNSKSENSVEKRPHAAQVAREGHFEQCPKLRWSETDITTGDVFRNFEFQPSWMRSKEYWNKTFEDRYERTKMDPERPYLKVFIVPHSHNDPGWLKTFENYFHSTSRQIMNNMVTKLQEYQNLTFIWSEISFLNAWWEEAHPSKQRILKELVQSGRLEITTGGWVMTDEATAHVYAIVDQLIEGHQWVYSNLGVKPKSGWSVDPFGHGNTVPYLLGASGLQGIVIQRIHYAWKQWLALNQYGDFKWVPTWTPNDPSMSILTHNQPFDIYSIKHSCGPHPYICLNFDFRKVPGEYTEYSLKATAITDKNIREKAELLLEQYAKTGSMSPHNVILTPLGDDFRYNLKEEFDQQYTNYVKLINYINQNKEKYKAEISFGTPKMYFDEIVRRYDQFPTLKGDFFAYSDIFSEGRPAYWTGYFTTRPFLKHLDRQLEHNLRSAEILYTMSLNYVKQHNFTSFSKILEKDYEKLIQARRNLGLFQHHDAITGTSKAVVMKDYGLKLFESLRDTTTIQHHSLQALIFPNLSIKKGQNMILSDIERESYDKLANKTIIQIGPNQNQKILIFNSLPIAQEHVVTLLVSTTNVKVQDSKGSDVVYQINPSMVAEKGTYLIEPAEYELVFIAKLEELSVTSFSLVYDKDTSDNLGIVYCNNCVKKNSTSQPGGNKDAFNAPFTLRDIPAGDIQLENQKMKLLFSGATGFLKSVTRKHKPKVMQCQIQFAAYKSAQFHSGSYLFKPDPSERDFEKDALLPYKEQQNVIITTGPVSTEILTVYGPFLIHKVTIYLDEKSSLSNGISIENTVDFENPPKNRETELFMRIVSDVQNGDPPEFYSDLNGFSMQKRVKVESIGIEGNYYPITSMAFIQDESVRLSLLTDHAQGAAAWQPGTLEVMLDRRTLYDDARGMGEGLVDNRKTTSRYWLLIEDVSESLDSNDIERNGGDDTFEKDDVVRSFNINKQPVTAPQNQEKFPRASLFATHMSNLLNYPAQVYIVDSENQSGVNDSIKFFNHPLPCDVFLLNLRTQPDSVYPQFPSTSALMVMHRQGYDCSVSQNYTCANYKLEKDNYFKFLNVKEMELKSLTGLDTISSVKSIGDVFIEPMSLKTLNITFG